MQSLKETRETKPEIKPVVVQVAVPCPACGEPASLVADLLNSRTRWCCTGCLTMGTVPWAIIADDRPANSDRPSA